MKKYPFLIALLAVVTWSLQAQQSPPQNWFNLDPTSDRVFGVSTEKAYNDLLSDKKSNTVVVAVIDSGIDYDHEDLKSVMWTNPGEVANNGIDDDGNGYIDDVHGWNFIGGKNGQNVNHDTYEVTRLYGKDLYRFRDADPAKLPKKVKKEYDQWLTYKAVVEEELEKAQTNLDRIEQTKSVISNSLSDLRAAVGDQILTPALMDSLKHTSNPNYMVGINVYGEAMAQGEKISSIDDMEALLSKDLGGAEEYYSNKIKYAYNPDFNTRTIVGDNYSDATEKYYGNNDIQGPDAFHGTHVAGIIGAKRHNGIGMNGVANDVAIMSVRTVPDGDERDKDVANAIRYAVDNGASVINMSFGKGQAWNKQVVDDAVKYAQEHDVLLVHAAGNSNQDNDQDDNFPNDHFEKKGLFCKKKASNWLEVGALSWKSGEDAIAVFSNYGKEQVDLFAPGVAIYSTVPESEYKNAQGTSMASPVVAGVAATVRSYFPTLTANQVKEILMKSVVPITQKVKRPGDDTLVAASDISVSGGVVNLYKAIELASTTKGKKKKNKA